jgi:hypothetical protein
MSRAGEPMQILESSALGLRSARLVFKGVQSGKIVTLFPMVHIGLPGFYRQVHEDALEHDAVLIEGLRSPITERVTRSYRWVINPKRLPLVVQPRLTKEETARTRVVHADLSHDEFVIEWRRVPLHIRLWLYVVGPVYGIYQRWFGTLESLAKGHSFDDILGRNEALGWSPELGAIHQAVLTVRDARLVSKLADLLDAPVTDVRSIAIIYGARHMRAVLRELTCRREYIASDTRWMEVF